MIIVCYNRIKGVASSKQSTNEIEMLENFTLYSIYLYRARVADTGGSQRRYANVKRQ